MKKILTAWILVVATTACGGSGQSAGDEAGAASPQELAETYRRLHDAGNVDGLVALVYSRTGNTEFHRMSFQDDVAYPILELRVEDVGPGDLAPWKERGIEPSLDPVAWLRITFAAPDGSPGHTGQYLIGVRDGRYRIASND